MRARALVAAAVAATLLLAGCTSRDGIAGGNTGGYISGDGTIMQVDARDRAEPPAWSGETDTGEAVSSDQLSGEVVVLNFWYAGCPPCREEAPELEQLAGEFADRAVFLGVNTRDSAAAARAFAEDFGVSYPSILDRETRSVLSAFAADVPPSAVPTTLVLDAEGRVAVRISGAIPSVGTVGDLIEDVLAEGA